MASKQKEFLKEMMSKTELKEKLKTTVIDAVNDIWKQN